MSRTSLMTVGCVLILVGVQLNLVESLVLTPTATGFLNERLTDPFETVPAATGSYSRNNAYASNNGYYAPQSNSRNNYPFSTPNYTNRQLNTPTSAYTAGYSRGTLTGATGNNASGGYFGSQRMITPPPWLCWPVIFLGGVTFLYGAALSRE